MTRTPVSRLRFLAARAVFGLLFLVMAYGVVMVILAGGWAGVGILLGSTAIALAVTWAAFTIGNES